MSLVISFTFRQNQESGKKAERERYMGAEPSQPFYRDLIGAGHFLYLQDFFTAPLRKCWL